MTEMLEELPVPVMDPELNAALAAAQGEFPPVTRDKPVTVRTRDGGTYSYSYASLDKILAAVRPVLAAHGLALVQRLEAPGGRPSLRTEIRHSSGGVIAASFPLPSVPDSPQQLGSLLTYLRRYAITAMLGIAAEEDDDARSAGTKETAPQGLQRKLHGLRSKLLKNGAISEEDWQFVMTAQFNVEHVNELTTVQAEELIKRLEAKERDHAEAEAMEWPQ